MFHSFKVGIILGSLLLLGACKPEVANATRQDADVVPAVSVQGAPVTEIEVQKTLHLTGTLRGFREADLAANATGRVLTTEVERGMQVTPGQVLARLDVRAATLSADETRAQADSARAQQEQAQKTCERYAKLKEKGAISDYEYDQMQTQCNTLPLTAEAAAARARLAAQNVGDGIVRAPFAGVVSERYIEVGQYVRQDTRVVSLVSLDPLRLELAVPEADSAKIQAGAEVHFRVAAYPEKSFTGKIKFLSGAVRATTRDLVVEALVDNPDKTLKPGMFADVELQTGTRRLPSLPRTAVLEKDGQARAYFLIAGRLEERVLSLGAEQGDRVSVLRGANLGEQVALDPKGLTNGQHLR